MTLKPKSILKLLYAVAIIILLMFLGLFLVDKWEGEKFKVQKLLVERAREVDGRVAYQLLDASRLLDIARSKLEAMIKNGSLSQSSAHHILQESINFFNINIHTHKFGILFYADKGGQIQAVDGDLKPPILNISDRAYFKNLIEYPNEKWSIGEHVIGRLSKQPTFHLATSLRDAKGEFIGAVFIQLRDDEFQDLNIYQSDQYPVCYLFFQRDGLVALQIPTNRTCYSPQFEKQLYEIAHEQTGKMSGDIELPAKASIDGRYYQIAFDKSVAFNTTVVASLQKKFIFWYCFLPEVAPVLLSSFIGFFFVSLLFFQLHRYLIRYEEVQGESMTDPLTSLRNRRSMDSEFPVIWKKALEKGRAVSVLFLDIDHFKTVNDDYGHEMGDDVLKAVAQTIRGCVARPDDLVCRWGGEEFVVVLNNTEKDGAVVVARRIMEAIRLRAIAVRGDILRAGDPIKVTVSVGIASIVVTTETADADLIDMADRAMLQAKEAGRNCYRIWRPSS